jgi:hypothetical protein
MPGPVLISSNSGSGHPADEAVLAAALRLLERGSWGAVRVLSQDVGCTGRAHPHVETFAEEDIDAALADCRLLMVVGDLSDTTRRERAARHLLSAKRQQVPVALVSVRLGGSCAKTPRHDDALRILAEAESITACDAPSATVIAHCMQRRIATTAPLELVLSAKPMPHASHAMALEGEFLEQLPESERRTVLDTVSRFAARHDLRTTVVFTAKAPSFALPETLECLAAPTWTQWMRALSQVRICIARPDSVALHLAVAQGAVPITQAAHEGVDLSERIGLHSFAAGMCTRSWSTLLEQALATRIEDVCARSAPVRVVAWRALGSLSEAVRSRPLALEDDPVLRRSAMRLLATHWRRLLQQGAFPHVESQLLAWSSCQGETAWAASRAQAFVLQGRDTAARVVLEDALTQSPQDSECLSMLAMILWRNGDPHAADRCWTRIIEAGGEDVDEARRQRDTLRTWMSVQEESLPTEALLPDVDQAATPSRTDAARRSTG